MDNYSVLDPDNIKLMLDEFYDYSKKEILKVVQNLDIIYGSSSLEKKNTLDQLHELWKICITKFLEDIVFESDRNKNEIIEDIEALLSEKATLEKELQVHIPVNDYKDTVPLIDVKHSIDEVLQECRAVKIELIAELNKLQEEENKICQLLSEEPKFSKIIDFPSTTLLETVKSHLIDLKNIQFERQSIFVEQKDHIESLFMGLRENPILKFDKMVLGHLDKFKLSKSNMDELQKTIKRLEDQTEKQKCMAMELRTILNLLWDRLQIDVTFRENFLKKEIERCSTLKRENIKIYIEKLRLELNDLWDKCHYGDRQRKQCLVYYDTEFNEDVMDLLDMEVDKLKKFYNDNQSIYLLIEKREKLWNKIIMMKENASDPNKLWKNRAGLLLKEERERKVIKKELPRVENELDNRLRVFEEKEGKHFLYNDERMLDVINNQLSRWKSSKKSTQQTKIQIKVQTPQTFPRSKKNIATTSSNQPSKVLKLGMDHKAKAVPRSLFEQNVAQLMPLNSTKLAEKSLTFNR